MTDKMTKDKKAEKLFYKGTGLVYFFCPTSKKWSLQVKNRSLISLLWKYFYNERYKPISDIELVVFKFHDYRFEEIAEFISQNYTPSIEVVK